MTLDIPLKGTYNPALVVLSIAVAICSAYAALDLARLLYKNRGWKKFVWLAVGSLAMGVGICGMHYVGMSAYHLPIPVEYDWPTVLVSILIAIAASGAALYEISRPSKKTSNRIAASVLMGTGISMIHYTGIRAMRCHATHHYSTGYVVLSLVLSIAFSWGAIYLAVASRESLAHFSMLKGLSAIAMGVAISSMHYIAMAGVSFDNLSSMNKGSAHLVSVTNLTIAGISATAGLLLLVILIMSAVSREKAHLAAEIEDQRLHLQKIFDNLKEAVVVLDTDRNIIQMNNAASELLGLEKGIVARNRLAAIFDMFLPTGELIPFENHPSALALRGEFLQSCELKVVRKDTGKSSIVDISTAPIRNRAGKIIALIMSYRDITQPKEIDQARMRLASIVESSEDAIIGRDLHGIINSWNAGAARMFGYTAGEMIGQSIRRLVPEDRSNEDENILARIRRGEIVSHIETIRRTKSGKFIHVSLMISPLRDSMGRIIGASKIARNITDRKDLEHRLHQSQKMEAIGQLTGGIAHDFNNLLAIVIGNLDLLERQIVGNDAAVKRVHTARSASLRGADLTRRMLAFARQQELRPSAIDLDGLIQNVLALAAPGLGPEIQIVTHLAPDVPRVFVDGAGLENALLNLVVNARDSMPKGGTLTLTTELRDSRVGIVLGQNTELDPGQYLYISVADTGHGMPSEVAQRAFEPFFTTKPPGKGTGLGLAMVYGFFTQSAGAVGIYSELGYGTTVSCYLPLFINTQVEAAPTELQDDSFDYVGTILVVDDEPELLEIATAFLAEKGYKVVEAKNGATALQSLEQNPEIDLLITDVIMPGGMNGAELAEAAVALRPDLKVIYCSGFPADAMAEKVIPLNKGPLLRKPYQRSELLTIVRGVLVARKESNAASFAGAVNVQRGS